MPWPCVMHEQNPLEPLLFRKLDEADWSFTFGTLPIGAMWFDDGELIVKLPSLSEWNIDRGRILNALKGERRLPQWSRIGEPPYVTADPSINHVGKYHGWLRNGILSDDCDGRLF